MTESPSYLHDTARNVLEHNGFLLTDMTWDADYNSMQIVYHREGFNMSLNVRGIPVEIPEDIFAALLDHMIRTKFKGERRVQLPPKVVNWIKLNV